MLRHRVFLYYLLSFLAGVLLHSIAFSFEALFSRSTLWIVILILLISLFIVSKLPSHTRLSTITKTFNIALILFASAFVIYDLHISRSYQYGLDNYVGTEEPVSLEFLVLSEPTTKKTQQFYAKVRVLCDNEDLSPGCSSPETHQITSKVLMRISRYPQLRYGDTGSIVAQVSIPQDFETNEGRVFAYKHYLYQQGVYYLVQSYETPKPLPSSTLSLSWFGLVQQKLYGIKNALITRMKKSITNPQSSLLAGLLFGKQSELPPDVEDDFRRTGLMHIVVLSGYNVSLVIALVTKLLNFRSRRLSFSLSLVMIIIFALMVGAGPTVLRASIMAMFLVLANLQFKQYNIIRSLCIAGVLMLIIQPTLLYFSLSFQLSFLATLGIIILHPLLNPYFVWVPTLLGTREATITSLSATIAVTPLLAYTIGEVSLVGPLVNVLVLGLVPYAMFFGFLASLFGPALGIITFVSASLAQFFLTLILRLASFFAQYDYATVSIQAFNGMIVIIIYLVIIFLVFKITKKHDTIQS